MNPDSCSGTDTFPRVQATDSVKGLKVFVHQKSYLKQY